MTSTTEFEKTPRYVLKNGKQTIFPTINFDGPIANCVCVYGFSDKPIYDQFIESVEHVLTPYPLVKGYLSNQITEAESLATNGHHLSLVILDATDHTQPVLSVASMAAVLLAQQENVKQVAIEFELLFDKKSASYGVKGGSNSWPPN